jgi:hypothetical protein
MGHCGVQGDLRLEPLMQSHSEKHTSVRRRAFTGVLLAVTALLAASSSALASQDELKGGSVAIQLQGSRGLKLKPSSLNLPITGGAVDPIDGSGIVRVSGGLRARRGKAKAKVRITALNLAANGGQGSVTAKVGKKGVTPFATLTGGTVTRDGFGAKIENITITLAGKGAQALNRAFSPKKKKSKASAAAKKGVKAGQPLGRVVSVVTVPLAVGIVPNTGTMSLSTNISGAFANKIPQHCISLLGGATPIAPASQMLANFSFRVSGGAIAPDFSAGEVLTAGGQKLTKDDGLLTPSGCSSASPPVGTSLSSTDIGVDFAHNALNSTAALPTGTSLRAPLADIDFSTGTRTFNPSNNTISISGATIKLSFPAALTLNQFFPTESGNASDDFTAGDEIGTIDLTGVKLR